MICCVTGHRPKYFPFQREDNDPRYINYIDQLYLELEKLIREGYRDFISGMADGADIDFANHVLFFRDIEEDITLEAALPYPPPYQKNLTDYCIERNCILMVCNKKTIVSPYYQKGCFQKRNHYMVDKSDLVLAIWNGKHSGGTWNTIKYAQSKNKKIRYIMLNEIPND